MGNEVGYDWLGGREYIRKDKGKEKGKGISGDFEKKREGVDM